MTVAVENDEKIEETESFSATLERTPDLDDRILLSPVDATISIIDDDSEFMTYTNGWNTILKHSPHSSPSQVLCWARMYGTLISHGYC